MDDGTKPSLNWSGFLHPIQYYNKLIVKKAPLIMAMIERRLTIPVFRKVSLLSLLFLFIDFINDFKILATFVLPTSASKGARLSTRLFLKAIKNEGGWKDVKQFEQQWIIGRECPKMISGFVFNKKRQQTEFVIKQNVNSLHECNRGTFVVRINEIDGSYDYSIPLTNEYHGIDLRCQSRLRKNRKKKIQFANGDEIEIDLTRRDHPLLWIRVDPKCNWGPLVEFKQPEYMWIHQLEMDRDPIAQYQAIRALSAQPTATVSTTLSQLMADPK